MFWAVSILCSKSPFSPGLTKQNSWEITTVYKTQVQSHCCDSVSLLHCAPSLLSVPGPSWMTITLFSNTGLWCSQLLVTDFTFHILIIYPFRQSCSVRVTNSDGMVRQRFPLWNSLHPYRVQSLQRVMGWSDFQDQFCTMRNYFLWCSNLAPLSPRAVLRTTDLSVHVCTPVADRFPFLFT